jgi:hypothetical protein
VSSEVLKSILFQELIAFLWAAAMSAVIVLIYQKYELIWKIFFFWLIVAQVLVVLRVARARKKRQI